MSSFVEIAGKKYESVSTAARLTGYSRDYIGRLAREEKITATQVGRQWFIFIPSLEKYAKSAEQDQQARQEKLSSERKREREEKELAREQLKKTKKRKMKQGAHVMAFVVLGFGIGLGAALNSASVFSTAAEKQIASAPQSESFVQTEQEFPVATGSVSEEAVVESIDFSRESVTISALDGEGEGVMLLPSKGKQLTEEEVKAMFSDPVHIVRDAEGNRYVVRKTADGKEERLPFAIVPVGNQEVP